MTSTPSPTPAQTSLLLASEDDDKNEEKGEGGEIEPENDFGMDLKLGSSELGGLGSLDIDVALMTTSSLPDDPFAPLPNTSNSDQLTSS